MEKKRLRSLCTSLEIFPVAFRGVVSLLLIMKLTTANLRTPVPAFCCAREVQPGAPAQTVLVRNPDLSNRASYPPCRLTWVSVAS